jgi:hypothetical protein
MRCWSERCAHASAASEVATNTAHRKTVTAGVAIVVFGGSGRGRACVDLRPDVTKPRTVRLVQIADLLGVSK